MGVHTQRQPLASTSQARRIVRRWHFWSEAPDQIAWEGMLCSAHAPLDAGGHLKPRALARYLATFPAEFARNIRLVGWAPRLPPDPDTCHVCAHERTVEMIARIGADDDTAGGTEPSATLRTRDPAPLHQPGFRPCQNPPWGEP
jgi:hypothetical protein